MLSFSASVISPPVGYDIEYFCGIGYEVNHGPSWGASATIFADMAQFGYYMLGNITIDGGLHLVSECLHLFIGHN
jgi:hypothetical protein